MTSSAVVRVNWPPAFTGSAGSTCPSYGFGFAHPPHILRYSPEYLEGVFSEVRTIGGTETYRRLGPSLQHSHLCLLLAAAVYVVVLIGVVVVPTFAAIESIPPLPVCVQEIIATPAIEDILASASEYPLPLVAVAPVDDVVAVPSDERV